jgi:hypothetical protein
MITYLAIVGFEDRPNILRLTEFRVKADDATQAKVKARKVFRRRFGYLHIDTIDTVPIQ